ncbi:hypothetical protein BXY47_1583 [Dietzia kunjamensis]|uniref:hypothetical protein n=1 Tax=Dietzia kunjamensis TaxID=322509 RepID=UPI000FF5F73A|nr:hypothetical protein [Dietzia kunjamensis]MBB1011109.1 hypothetical protein [Dietzia kunjamensis]RKE65424.1 hypothetical protein BXY47_1583 [Dietzia kunjamensis]
MAKRIEVTDKVQRIESIERKLGVSIQSIFAEWRKDKFSEEVIVNFDILSQEDLNSTLVVTASIYNAKNQLIATDEEWISEDSFIGFQSVSIAVDDVPEPPTLIRLSVKPL